MATIKSVNLYLLLNGDDFNIIESSYHIIDRKIDDILDIIEYEINNSNDSIQTFLRDQESFKVNKPGSGYSYTVLIGDPTSFQTEVVSKETAIREIVKKIVSLDFGHLN